MPVEVFYQVSPEPIVKGEYKTLLYKKDDTPIELNVNFSNTYNFFSNTYNFKLENIKSPYYYVPDIKSYYLYDVKTKTLQTYTVNYNSTTLNLLKTYPRAFYNTDKGSIMFLNIENDDKITPIPYTLNVDKDSYYMKHDERIYSKQIIHQNASPYLLYATMDGSAFVCLEFNDSMNITRVHHCIDSPKCNSYMVYSIDKKQKDFDAIYSFKVAILPDNYEILLHRFRTHLRRTGESNCLIKQLKQTRGFCYYHMVLHGLLIPNFMKQLCCKKLLEYMTLLGFGQTSYSLDTFININICENFDKIATEIDTDSVRLIENTRYYIMKFFYQYLFYFEEIYEQVQRSEHYIYHIEDAKRYGYYDVSTKPIAIHPIDILVRHEKPAYKGLITEIPEGGNSYEVATTIFKTILGLQLLELQTNQPNTASPDIYVYRFGCLNHELQNCEIKPPDMPTIYNLEMGLISIYLQKNGKPSAGHGIVGVICNGEKYLIDSNKLANNNEYYSCDWTSMKTLMEHYYIKNGLYMNARGLFSSANNVSIQKIEIDMFYIKKDSVSVINTCNKIKATYILPRILNAIQSSSLDATIKASLENTMKEKTFKNVKQLFSRLPPLRRNTTTSVASGGGAKKRIKNH